MRKLAISWRLWGRYWRLKQACRRQERKIGRIEAVHAAEIKEINAATTREISRLNKLNLHLQTEIDILQREGADRVMEALKMVGPGYATRDTDERIRDLRFEQFEPKQRQENFPFTMRHNLSADDQARYDEAFEAHRQRGFTEGYDEATINRIWTQHEERVIEDLHTNWQ